MNSVTDLDYWRANLVPIGHASILRLRTSTACCDVAMILRTSSGNIASGGS